MIKRNIPYAEAMAIFQVALTYYDKQNYKSAFPIFEKLAKDNIPEAQYNLALMYENGEGVKQNINKAVELYKIAAYQDYLPAAYNLGMIYVLGQGLEERNLEMAVKWFEIAASENDPSALFNLGCVYYEGGYGIEKDDRKALMWWQKAAIQGHPIAYERIEILKNENKNCNSYIPNILGKLYGLDSLFKSLSNYATYKEENYIYINGIINAIIDEYIPILKDQYILNKNNYIKILINEIYKMHNMSFHSLSHYTKLTKFIDQCSKLINKAIKYEEKSRKNMKKEVIQESPSLRNIKNDIDELNRKITNIKEKIKYIDIKIKSLRNTEHNEEISLINHKINNINFKINKTKKAIKYGKIEKLKGCTIINKLEERKDNQFSIIKELQKNIFKKIKT